MSIQSFNISFPKAFQFLFKRGFRYYVAYGGRGSAKSTSFCRALVMLAASKPLRILCTRQYQVSIQDSVYKLLIDSIESLGLSAYFDIGARSITSKCGSEFIFKGLAHSINEIKSLEGVDICFVEEAQSVSSASWDVLIPTIRKKGSEIWVCFNPENDEDSTYQRFVVHPPPDSIVKKVNFDDNPFFKDTALESERLHCLNTNEDDYNWIWLGQCRKISYACIFKNKFIIQAFDTPERSRFYLGSDFGFAADPSTLVRSFIQGKTLYIDYEAYAHGIDIDKLPALYDTIPDVRKWTIHGDSARPDTISYLKRQGFRIEPCIKGPGSVDDGIAYLKGFQQIIIHPRCVNTAKEFRAYSWKVDRVTKEILPIPVDDNNHVIDAVRYSLSKLIRNPGTSMETWAKLAERN
jgi:phage terminase large subunit